MTGFNWGNCENKIKTNNYLLKLKAVDLDCSLQLKITSCLWTLMWPGIDFLTLYATDFELREMHKATPVNTLRQNTINTI